MSCRSESVDSGSCAQEFAWDSFDFITPASYGYLPSIGRARHSNVIHKAFATIC